ncbi:MAG TPA: type IIA DNA topoisomerase subunit B, partial [Chryseosolibacter sp.]
QTIYCYSEEEKQAAMKTLGGKVEITRFKGLGEISPDEFGGFIGENIRLQPVLLYESNLNKILEFYMGKNTPTRQEFIIDNLRIELDKVEKGDEEAIVLEENEA